MRCVLPDVLFFCFGGYALGEAECRGRAGGNGMVSAPFRILEVLKPLYFAKSKTKTRKLASLRQSAVFVLTQNPEA